LRELPNASQFVAYVDAVGELDGQRYLMDWKTTSSRYPEEPAGMLSLDPQLICYSWMTGISDVAVVVLRTEASAGDSVPEDVDFRRTAPEFGQLVGTTISQIEAAQFPSHSGIRFPQNGCVNCSHLGLCLHDQALIESSLIRTPGANDLAWLDELVD